MRALVPALISVALATPTTPAQDGPPKVGERFPGLAFPTLKGGELSSISDFEGQKVLLIQFASW